MKTLNNAKKNMFKYITVILAALAITPCLPTNEQGPLRIATIIVCSACWDPVENQTIEILPCNHQVHSSCAKNFKQVHKHECTTCLKNTPFIPINLTPIPFTSPSLLFDNELHTKRKKIKSEEKKERRKNKLYNLMHGKEWQNLKEERDKYLLILREYPKLIKTYENTLNQEEFARFETEKNNPPLLIIGENSNY